jgi:hypothetical protein
MFNAYKEYLPFIGFLTVIANLGCLVLWHFTIRNASWRVMSATESVLSYLKEKGEMEQCKQVLRRLKNNIKKRHYNKLQKVVYGEESGK